MKDYKRITDADVFKVLDDLEKKDEQALDKAWKTQLLLLLDIRHFLRKMYKQMPARRVEKLVTDPLKATEKDIVIRKDE